MGSPKVLLLTLMTLILADLARLIRKFDYLPWQVSIHLISQINESPFQNHLWNIKESLAWIYMILNTGHYNLLLNRNCSWILFIHKARISQKKAPKRIIFVLQKMGWKNILFWFWPHVHKKVRKILAETRYMIF